MNGEVIKSFLVGLGFGVDEASLSKFNKAIASATLKVTALYGSIQAAATGIGYGITKISEDFERMGYEYHIIAPAINKALLLRRELLKAYTAAGINITKVVKDSLQLNLSLTKTKFAFEAIYKSVASRFFSLLTKQSDIFRNKLYANMPKIEAALEHVIQFIFKAFEATLQLGERIWSILGRVFDFFVKLHEATGGWSTVILGAVAAWKLLNLEFLATPLGALVAGLTTLLTLYDDFKTYQEGGKSFFNWGPVIPIIDAVTGALKSLWSVLQGIADTVGNVFLAIYQLFKGDFQGVWQSLADSGQAILNIFSNLWSVIKGIGSSFSAFDNFLSRITGVPQNISIPSVNPISNRAQNNQSNVNVTQQNNTTITGVPDAQKVGHVMGQTNRQNFDLARNLPGSIRPGGILQ